MSVRRLPVYILADCSGSMSGAPIESVKTGIRALHAALMGDPSAVESAYLSVISFDSDARQLAPLTEIAQFSPPELAASGQTAFGRALNTLIGCINNEVRKTTADQKGDWKPLVFILTDGLPTDEWQTHADELKKRRPGNIIALACGDGADSTLLKSVAETVLVMKEMSPDAFRQFFKWVSDSVRQTSAKIGSSSAPSAVPVTLPPPPPAITLVP